MRDKLNNLVLFDKATYEKLYKEVPNYKLITPAVVSERLKIRGSLARNALQELLTKGECHVLTLMFSRGLCLELYNRTALYPVFTVQIGTGLLFIDVGNCRSRTDRRL